MVHHVTAPKSLLSFLKSKKIQILDWPGNSPDFNPIENLWTVLKDKVSEKQPASAKELVDAIKAVWVHELSAEYCWSLVESMPNVWRGKQREDQQNTDFSENSVSKARDFCV